MCSGRNCRVLAAGGRQDDLPGLAARHAVAEAMTHHAEIVFELGLEPELFERRHLNVVGRLSHLDHRGTIARHVGHDLGRQLVGTPFPVDQLNLEAPRVGKREGRAVDVLAISERFERDRLALRVDQLGRGDVFVQPAKQGQLGPFDRRDVANVFDGLRLERRVLREDQLGVGTLELRVFKHTNMKRFRALSLKLRRDTTGRPRPTRRGRRTSDLPGCGSCRVALSSGPGLRRPGSPRPGRPP